MNQNILIIGAGPAGEAASRALSKRGAQVTLVEKENAGGLCLNKGCIPSKTLLEHVHKSLRSNQKINWSQAPRRKNKGCDWNSRPIGNQS